MKLRSIAAIFFGLAACLSAEVRLPAVITDHMVIQRGQPVHIWGWADAGEAVSVSFRDHFATATADELGRWSANLPPGDAGGPFFLQVKGTNTIAINDVLVGDVWIASGQSNMEFSLAHAQNAAAEIAAANYPKIRLFTVERGVSGYPLEDVKARPWAACTPESAPTFSAVAYFFGRDLNKKFFVPIGLIHTSWGGTPAEAWTSMDGLGSDASLMPVFAEWAKVADETSADLLARDREKKLTAEAKAQGHTPPSFPWRRNERLSWMPAGLYNAMVAPLTPFPIKGAIWYQGESNATPERAYLYNRLFKAMISDWRNKWGQGDFPFLFVQIANYKNKQADAWATVRDAQRRTLALRNTGMAVTIDIGNPDNIHPTDKQDVGARLALAARAIAYHENIEYSGPLFRQAKKVGNSIQVWFDHADGLTAKGGAPQAFEVAGADRKFQVAQARIDGDTVVVSSPAVPDPQYVRYGWSDNPPCNLYNKEGLPASPFTSE
jgi:sialate O-acetylesterase